MPEHSDSRSLDHFIISVLDAETAGDNYERLGFHVLPLMRHIELRSCNRIVQFADTYIELIGDLHKATAVHGNRMIRRFDLGEGLSLVSLTSSDLEGDNEYLREAGMSPDSIISARRKVLMPDGGENETDSSCFYVWRKDKGYLSLFLSAHRKPDTIFIPKYYESHRNGAQAVTSITYFSKDPLADVGYFSTMFRSEPVGVADDCVRFQTPRGEVLHILSGDRLAATYHHVDWGNIDQLAGVPVSLDVRVESIEQCQSALANAGVEFRLENSSVMVDPAECNGVLFRFHP